jgi:zinc-ribbon domain
MFCPKCAAQNLEGASFCRSCGANISLVPQAMTGQVAPATPDEALSADGCGVKRGRKVTLDQAVHKIFMGIAFLLIALALSRSIGEGWWFWLLLPGFSLMGKGVAQFIRVKEREKQQALGTRPSEAFLNRPNVTPVLPARNTDVLMPPVPSVTEGTTRHLGVEAQTRHLESSSEQK